MKKTLLLNLIVFAMLAPLFIFAAGAPRALPQSADLVGTLQTVANWLFTLLMAAAAISIVVAAFVFIGSGGDSEKMATARNWVIYALVGVLVALLAQVLVNFVDSWVP